MSLRTQTEVDSANAMFNVEDEYFSEKMTKDQCNIRRHTVFDTAQSAEEETIIRHDASLFTSEEATEPLTALKIATARAIDAQQAEKCLPDSSSNFFGRLFPHLFPYGAVIPNNQET